MPQIPIEDYFEKLRKSDPKYHWPLKRAANEKTKRDLIHEEFPYVITYSGMYSYSPGSLLDDMEDWCREKFGDRHGECEWRECEWDWDRWHEESGLEAQLDNELYHKNRGPRPNRDKEPKAWDKWQKIGDKIIDKHFKIAEKRLDVPGEHCHWGTWTSHFVCKTGYDYGYEDYCFKNISDAVYFKIMWHEEAERRG